MITQSTNRQISMFDLMMPEVSINKPIRLIELFGGYGSQSMALKRIGANFEHYKLVEFDPYAVASYNAVHGTHFKPTDITQVHFNDLEIKDEDKYTYMMTYSFPCQDLSLAGKRKGMTKGSGTRSGLLWEVERLLKELDENGKPLPEILFMENVPQVIASANIDDFNMWQDFLKSLGYTNYVKVLNSKDYGVAQNRERCFMLSFLGEYNYHFPEPIVLEKRLKDYLETDVDEKYYIKNEKARKLIDELMKDKNFVDKINKDDKKAKYINENASNEKNTSVLGSIYCENSKKFGTSLMDLSHTLKASKCDVAIVEKPKNIPKINIVGNYSKSNHDATRIVETDGIAPTVRECHGSVTAIVEKNAQINMLGLLDIKGNEQIRRVYGVDGLSPTISTMNGGNRQPKIMEQKSISTNGDKKVTSATIRGRYDDNGKVKQHLEKGSADYSNALTTVAKDSMILEKVGQISSDGSQCGSVYSDEGLFPTLSAGCHGYANPHIYTQYRIRKLTPVECGRLMDVEMDDIIRMIVSDHNEANDIIKYMNDNDIKYRGKAEMDMLSKHQKMSNSRLYKQFGNSIVVNVMCAMFRNLNIKGIQKWSD